MKRNCFLCGLPNWQLAKKISAKPSCRRRRHEVNQAILERKGCSAPQGLLHLLPTLSRGDRAKSMKVLKPGSSCSACHTPVDYFVELGILLSPICLSCTVLLKALNTLQGKEVGLQGVKVLGCPTAVPNESSPWGPPARFLEERQPQNSFQGSSPISHIPRLTNVSLVSGPVTYRAQAQEIPFGSSASCQTSSSLRQGLHRCRASPGSSPGTAPS